MQFLPAFGGKSRGSFHCLLAVVQSAKQHKDRLMFLQEFHGLSVSVYCQLLNLPESFLSLSIKERLSNLNKMLSNKIRGQSEALKKVSKGIVTSKLGFDINESRPDGVFLFIGPTGVGKTETAISLAKALYGSEDFLIRLDMSEYMEKYTYSRFVGAAPGYVGYNDSNQLTDKIRQNPFSRVQR